MRGEVPTAEKRMSEGVCMYMCPCVHVCTCVCVRACVGMCVGVCMHVHLCRVGRSPSQPHRGGGERGDPQHHVSRWVRQGQARP